VPERSALAPLRRPAFRRLSLSYAINEMGDWLGLVALSVLVFDLTGSALATTLLFLGTGFVPALLTPVFVARMERQPPRFVLPGIYAAEAAAFLALALLVDNFSLAAVVTLAAIDGALALTAKTLTRAVTAAMLDDEGELRAGNAILNVAFTAGAAVGPVAAGAVVAALGVQTALLLDAISFYAIAWIVFRAQPLPQAESEPGRLRARIRAGAHYIRDHATLSRLISAQSVAIVFFTLAIPVEVVYAKETLGASDTGYGLLLASWGTGMVVGSAVFASMRRTPLRLLLFFSTIGVGAGYLGMAAAPTLAVACSAAAVGGIGNGVQWVTVVSAVQGLTASSMQARVISVLESMSSAMPGIGFLLGGLIATVYDARVAFAVAGFGAVLTALLAAPLVGSRWPEQSARPEPSDAADDAVMVELIPAVQAGLQPMLPPLPARSGGST
jgi:predicted MFS family arabinose efflux permease